MTVTANVINAHRDSGNTATLAVSVLVAVPAGNTLIVAVNAPVTGSVTAWAISDTKGNTYTQRTTQNNTPLNYQMAILDSKLTTGLTTSDTLTITVTGASPAKWCVYGISANDATSYDVQGSNFGSSSAPTVTSSTASANSQLVVGALAWTDSTGIVDLTPGSGFTGGSKVTASAASVGRSLQVEWRYVSASGTRTANGTLDSSQGWGALVAAYTTVQPTMNHRFNGSVWTDLKDGVKI